MIQLSLMPKDLADEAGKAKVPRAWFEGTYLYLGTDRERSGGHRSLSKGRKNSRWSISLADRAIKEKLDRMFPGEASVEAVIEPVKLGDGTVAVYIMLGGAA